MILRNNSFKYSIYPGGIKIAVEQIVLASAYILLASYYILLSINLFMA